MKANCESLRLLSLIYSGICPLRPSDLQSCAKPSASPWNIFASRLREEKWVRALHQISAASSHSLLSSPHFVCRKGQQAMNRPEVGINALLLNQRRGSSSKYIASCCPACLVQPDLLSFLWWEIPTPIRQDDEVEKGREV